MPFIALTFICVAVYVFFNAFACVFKNIAKGKPSEHWLDGLNDGLDGKRDDSPDDGPGKD